MNKNIMIVPGLTLVAHIASMVYAIAGWIVGTITGTEFVFWVLLAGSALICALGFIYVHGEYVRMRTTAHLLGERLRRMESDEA